MRPPRRFRSAAAVLATLACAACAFEPPPPPAPDDPLFEGRAPAANLRSERVAQFDPSVDYFPEKASFRHATKIDVEYRRHFKIATVVLEGMAGHRQQILMVQRGTPRPAGYPDAEIVWVPVRRWSARTFTMVAWPTSSASRTDWCRWAAA